ncbi:MAG: hypothetical protein LBD73_02155 [Deferribacteraceae bacterium]|nr:hypothetical protein [Deferribacteraceae bacterium]
MNIAIVEAGASGITLNKGVSLLYSFYLNAELLHLVRAESSPAAIMFTEGEF